MIKNKKFEEIVESESLKEIEDNNEKNIKSRSKYVIIIAALFFVLSIVFKVCAMYIPVSEVIIAIIEIIATLTESISGIILGISIGSMLLDFFSYVEYMKARIQSVVVEKDFLETVSYEEKKRIISILESSLYFNDMPISKDSLYSNIKNKIIPLIEKEHYEKTYVHIECKIENNKIYKEIHNEIVLNAETEGTIYNLPFGVYFNKKDIFEDEKAYTITDVKVNGELIKIPEDIVAGKESPTEKDKQVFSFEYPLKLKKGENTICYVVKSIVNINDNTYSRTITVPCKNCVVEMYMLNENYSIIGQGFAIDKKETVSIKYFNNACRIEFKDWIIPGDGCIFIINPKNT